MDTNFPKLLKTWLLLALGVVIASSTASGISYDSEVGLIVAVLLLSLVNVLLKPLLMLFALPFIVLTLGLGIWLINALLFLLVGHLVEDFHVATFGNALWGALVVSVTGAIANILFAGKKGRPHVRFRANVNINRGGDAMSRPEDSSRIPEGAQRHLKSIQDDDVIDI